jgi:GNAT superfamily N-acetyltransferase
VSIDLDTLAESARNRGLKLIRSRIRTPGKRRFGKVGLTDAKGKLVFGMDDEGPTAKPEEVEAYLRDLGSNDWSASLGSAAATRARKKAKAKPKPKPAPPPPKPELRDAKPADAPRLAELIGELGHEVDAKVVRKNLGPLGEANETPIVATLGKEVVGLCGIHRMRALHRDRLVGRVNILIVTKSAQGQGIGRMLVEEAERRLKKLGCGRIEITVGEERDAAQAFYRHLGYERTTIRFQKIF